MIWYYLLQGVGIALTLLYVLLAAIRFRLPRLRAVGFAAFSCAAGVALLYLFRALLPEPYEGRNGFLIMSLFPLIFCLCSGIFRLPILQMPELASPTILILFGFDRIGCHIVGRCASNIQWDCGIPLPGAQEKLLPLQLAEAAAALLIAALLIVHLWKRGKGFRSFHMAWVLILFGTIQFVSSFLRDTPILVYRFTELSVWALFFITEGCMWIAASQAVSRLRETLEKS